MKPYRGAAAWAAWAVVCSLAAAQTRVDLRTQSKAVDFAEANSTRPFKTGTTLPATCAAGEAFFKTDAPAGQNLYGCTAANVWTLEGGGAGMAAQLGDFAVTRTSGSVLAIGSNCSSSMPCNVRTGGVVRIFTAPATATLSSGSGTAYVYVDAAGTLTVGHNLGLTCSGCTAVSGVTAFPAQSVPLFTWTATSGVWDAAGGSDRRAFLSDRAVSGGTGIVTTEAGGPTVVAVDPATVPLYSAGTTLPGACTVGEQFIKTDAPAGQRVYFCTAANTWTQPSGAAVTLGTTAPLSGGGSLDQNRTLSCAICTTSAAALGADAIVKGGGGQALAASGATIDGSSNISTPGSLTTGAGTGTTGKLSLSGATSGTVDVTVNSAAGTWALTLPSSAGTNGQPLITNGSGLTSFATLEAAGGGTGLTSAADDQVMVGSGAVWQSKALPDCPDATGNHLNYTAASNSFSCGTSGGAGDGANTALSNLAAVAINTALLPAVAAGSDLGGAALPWAGVYLAGDSASPASNYFRITGTSTGGARTVTLANADSVTVQPATAVAQQFVTGIGTDGAVTRAQPSATDLSEGTTGSGAVVRAGAPTLIGPALQSYTVATLPAATANKVVIVTDGASAGDCTAGGGSTRVLCHYNGSVWAALGDGNSGAAPSFADITAGTNTAALVIGAGGSLATSGSGTITATGVQSSAGAAPVTNATVAYDSTSHTYEGGVNGANKTFAMLDVAQTWGAGVKQTFNPNATNAGINVGSVAGDPSTPVNGDLWYNSTANKLTARMNGTNVDVGAGNSTIDPTTTAFVSDEFMCGGTAVGTVGCLGWYPSAAGFIGPPGSVSGGATVMGAPGQMQIDTGATINTVRLAALQTSNVASAMTAAETFVERWKINNITGTSPGSNITVRVGFFGSTTSYDPPNDGIYLEHLSSDTNWFCVVRASGSETRQDTSVAFSSNAVALQIRRVDASTIGCKAASTLGGLGPASETTNAATAPTADVTPGIMVKNAAAEAKRVNVDYFDLTISGLSR